MTRDEPVSSVQSPPLLVVEDLRVKFGGIVAVDGVSLTTSAGEIMGLVGPNGAGKTTFLNAISGLVEMSGRVEVDGKLVSHLPLHEHAAAGIGRAFQNVELLPSLNVIENILLGAHHRLHYSMMEATLFRGRARRAELQIREEADAIIEFFELEAWRDRPVSSLSYGRQKLIGVARAMAASPKIILLDEVGSGLNREEKEDLSRFVLRMKALGNMGIVWIEHDIGMVRELADSVTVLEYGRQLASGNPSEVLRLDTVRRAFTGEKESDK